MAKPTATTSFAKRLFDVAAALVVLVGFGWFVLLLALLVRIKLGGPVFFVQQRPGLNGKPFSMVKFRSMTSATDADGNLLPDDQRLTTFGQFLRSTSLDELPEFWNVLKGEMSVVGPRPLLTSYLDRYTERQARRHLVRPGITGWAQVNGRNGVEWSNRLEMDVWYVENWSFALDLRILGKTVETVLRRRGVSAEGHATMPEFRGEREGVEAS